MRDLLRIANATGRSAVHYPAPPLACLAVQMQMSSSLVFSGNPSAWSVLSLVSLLLIFGPRSLRDHLAASFPAFYPGPSPTRSLFSIRFSRSSLPVTGDKVSHWHTARSNHVSFKCMSALVVLRHLARFDSIPKNKEHVILLYAFKFVIYMTES
jgi:hypothetical protein